MNALLPIAGTLAFGPFRLDVGGRRLTEAGRPVTIGDRALDLLIALAERPGEVVSKAELIARVWPDTYVEEVNLRVQVSALRRALGGAADAYVASAPGRGYRFVAAMEAQTAHGAPSQRRRVWPTLVEPVGREAEMQAIARRLGATRLLSIVGPGGIGKTTLALACARAVADRYADGVAFAEVSGRASPAVEVAASFGLRLRDEEALASLTAYLAPLELLVVLDGSEYAIDDCARLVEAIAQAAPGVVVLATSREPLRAAGEAVWRLEPLATAPVDLALSAAAAIHYPAVQLFAERAGASDSAFELTDLSAPVVADICSRLDGLPLAIELAAGYVGALGLDGVRAGLDNRFQLLRQGRRTAMPRHRTLAAAIDWSYESLTADEQRTLRSFGLFQSPFDAAAAARVALGYAAPSGDILPVLSSLVDKSLVGADTTVSPARYRLLDTTRDYARLKLEAAGELPAAGARHAAYTLEVLSSAGAQLDTRPMHDWLDYFGRKLDDVGAALDWCHSAVGDQSIAVALTLAAAPVWERLWRYQEGFGRILAALEVAAPDSRDEMMLRAALGSAFQSVDPGPHSAEAPSRRALELARRCGDPPWQLRASYVLWSAYIQGGRVNDALRALAEHMQLVAREGDDFQRAVGDRMAGVTQLVAGDLAKARAPTDRLLAARRANRQDSRLRLLWYAYDPDVLARNTSVSLLWLEGSPDSAITVAEDNLGRALAAGNDLMVVAVLMDTLCPMALNVGDMDAAERHVGFLETLAARGAPCGDWVALYRATLAALRGATGPGLAWLDAGGLQWCATPRCTSTLTELALALGKGGASEPGRRLADQLLQRIETNGERWIWSEVQRVRGELCEDAATAEGLFRAALETAEAQGARAWSLRAATSLVRRRPDLADKVLAPLVASFTQGSRTKDLIAAHAVLHKPAI